MKGMTNALPVLIDASTLATKSDISDMETKTSANATFATKTALTTLQNATKVAVENFAITESADKVTITTTAIDGATSKSEDIPAVTDTMAGVLTAEWFTKLKSLWTDAHPPGYTLTIKGVYSNLVPYCELNNVKYYPDDKNTVTIPDLQKNTTYTIYPENNYSSNGLDISYKKISPSTLTLTTTQAGFKISNTELTDATIEFEFNNVT